MSSLLSHAGRPNLRGVIFDMDGTLTLPNLDFDELYRRCGVSTSDDLLAEVAKMSPERQAAANAIIEEMEAEGARTAQLAPGVVELVTWLKAHNIPIALVTRNSQSTLAVFNSLLWEPAGLLPFTPAITRNDPYLPKPFPGECAQSAACSAACSRHR
jgi:beta-phosphoglucomutase-like phosphatase (HAD superfamily)